MLSPEENKRYSRQMLLPEIGMDGQQKLKAAKVLVIGAGGLGCPVLQYLAAAGVGCIGIADGDTVEETNLQRQVLYALADVGKPKALVAAEKIALINSFITINVHNHFVTAGNALQLIEPYNIVVDGTDNFAARYLINDACVMLGKPLVFASLFKFEGQVSVFNYKDGPTYHCLFPVAPQADEAPNCAAIGVIATLPGIIGTIQANEVLKIILDAGNVLSGRLLVFDVLTMQTSFFSFKAVVANKQIKQLPEENDNACAAAVTITYSQLQQLLLQQKVQLIDVREPAEHAAGNIGGINIPMVALQNALQQLSKQNTLVLYCASGMRSAKAAELLLSDGFTNVYSLYKGLNNI